MEISLRKKQYAIGAIFKGSIFGYDKPDNPAISLAGINEQTFLSQVKNEFLGVVFDDELSNAATEIDSLRLYEVISYPGDPDIDIVLRLFKNTATSYYLAIKK